MAIADVNPLRVLVNHVADDLGDINMSLVIVSLSVHRLENAKTVNHVAESHFKENRHKKKKKYYASK